MSTQYVINVGIDDGHSLVWSDEIGVLGVGASLREAEDAFLDAVFEYASDWLNGLGLLALHRQHAPLVHQVATCDQNRDVLRSLLLPEDTMHVIDFR